MTTHLFKRTCTDEGYETYFNLFLVWEREGKIYSVEVKPSFKSAYRILLARAVEVPNGEPFEKYM